MGTSLPFDLREGTVAYALQVMANFRALLNGINIINVEGLGQADVGTLLNLLCEAMVKANEDGNASQIKFADGDDLEEKFAAGRLNAAVLNNEGLFYFHVGPADGHLYVTAAEGIDEDDFEINDLNGHLLFTLDDPDDSNTVHTYDLGKVVGDKGDPGEDGMVASVYDPNGVEKDLNRYTGYFVCYAALWDEDSKEYVLKDDDEQQGGETIPGGWVTGAKLSGHITSASGHALIGPAYNAATDDEVEAWANAMVRVVSQGNGEIVFKALGDIPETDINLQITMFV